MHRYEELQWIYGQWFQATHVVRLYLKSSHGMEKRNCGRPSRDRTCRTEPKNHEEPKKHPSQGWAISICKFARSHSHKVSVMYAPRGKHQGLGELCSKNRSWWTPHQKMSDCFKNEYMAEKKKTIWNCRKFQTWICKHHYIKKFNPKDGPKGLANAITNPMVIGKELIALIEALKLTDPGLRALVMHGAELPRQAVHITWKDKATWPAYARTWHGMASSEKIIAIVMS